MSEPSNYAPCRQSNGTQRITITLERNVATRDWSLILNGQRHEHVTTGIIEALVECELIVAFLTHEQDSGDTPAPVEAIRQP
jgi:hypothetical protein